jgi:hypothetical protein
MEPEQMEQMRKLLYNAIVKQLNTPYQSKGYFGEAKKGKSPRKASGSLLRGLSVDWAVDFEQGDPLLVVSFDTEPDFLAQMIDQGRKPSLKYPPLDAIKKWIKIKPIYFRDEKGRFKKGTLNSRAFLIARSIKEKGFAGINFLTKAEQQVINELTELGEQAAAEYFENLIDEGLVTLKLR